MNRYRVHSLLLCTVVALGIVALPRIIGTAYRNAGAVYVSKAWAGTESFNCSAAQEGSVEPKTVDYLQTSTRWMGRSSNSSWLLAMTFARLGEYDASLQMLASLLNCSPSARVFLCMGDIYNAMSSSTQARGAWLMSRAGNIFLSRAELAIARQDPDQGSENLAIAYRSLDDLKYYRRLADAYMALGRQYRNEGREQASLEAMAQATDVYDYALSTDTLGDQAKIMFRVWRAQSFRERQMFAQAVDDLEQVVEVEPTGWAYAELGVTYGYLENWPKAIWAFRSGLDREFGADPSSFPYWIQLGVAYRKNREFARALEVLEQVVRESRSTDWQAWAYTEMGITLAIEGNVLRSLSPLESAVALAPNWVHARLALASSLVALKHVNEACEQYRIVIGLDPENELALTQIAYLQCRDLSQIIQ